MLWIPLAFATPPTPTATSTPTPDPAKLYATECGACHFAFPARFLPIRSWTALIGDLSHHFGEDASLDAASRGLILTWLMGDAADLHRSRIPADQTPLRITELPWFRGEHAEIPSRYVKDNPAVKSLARCDACHTRAGEGHFGEGDLRIPGVGRWEEEGDDD